MEEPKLAPLRLPPLIVKDRSLRSCATLVGFACRFISVTSIIPALIENIALASTGSPLIEDPAGVVKVTLPACAHTQHIPQKSKVRRTLIFDSFGQ